MPATDGWFRVYNPNTRAKYNAAFLPNPDDDPDGLVHLEDEATHDEYGSPRAPEYDVDPPKSKPASKSAPAKTEEVSK